MVVVGGFCGRLWMRSFSSNTGVSNLVMTDLGELRSFMGLERRGKRMRAAASVNGYKMIRGRK